MKILKITDNPDGSAILDLEINEEDNNMLIEHAINNLLKEYIKSKEKLIKPKPPLIRIIKEGDTGKKCSKCGSSLKYKFWPFKSKYCIQPKCENYYGNYTAPTKIPIRWYRR